MSEWLVWMTRSSLVAASLLAVECTSVGDRAAHAGGATNDTSNDASANAGGARTRSNAGNDARGGGTAGAVTDAARVGPDAPSEPSRDAGPDGSASCDPGTLACPSQNDATCCTYCDCMTSYCPSWFSTRAACMAHCMALRQDQLCCQYSYCLASLTGEHCNHAAGECCACPQ